jgi:hypothetical protein
MREAESVGETVKSRSGSADERGSATAGSSNQNLRPGRSAGTVLVPKGPLTAVRDWRAASCSHTSYLVPTSLSPLCRKQKSCRIQKAAPTRDFLTLSRRLGVRPRCQSVSPIRPLKPTPRDAGDVNRRRASSTPRAAWTPLRDDETRSDVLQHPARSRTLIRSHRAGIDRARARSVSGEARRIAARRAESASMRSDNSVPVDAPCDGPRCRPREGP